VDDWNLDDEHLTERYAHEDDTPEQIAAENECLVALRGLTPEERASAVALADGYWPWRRRRSQMAKEVDDPVGYHRHSEPFATREEANAAIDAFFDDVKAAREKHRIANAHLVVQVLAADQGPGRNRLFALYHLGSSTEALHMAAYAYATER